MRTHTRTTQGLARRPICSLSLFSKWIDEQSYSIRKKKEREREKTCYYYYYYLFSYWIQSRLFTYNKAQRSSINNARLNHRNEPNQKNDTTVSIFLVFERFLILFGAFHSSSSSSLLRDPSIRVVERHIILTKSLGQIEPLFSFACSLSKVS